MTRRRLIFIASLVIIAGAGRAFAHHSFTAAYESGKRVEIEGVVKEFIWRNPHSFVRIEVTTREGKESFSLELTVPQVTPTLRAILSKLADLQAAKEETKERKAEKK